MIFDDLKKLRQEIICYRHGINPKNRKPLGYNWYEKFVCISGGFDPLNGFGHLAYIKAAKKLGRLIVIVNGDDFLLRKKGYAFMPLTARMAVIDALRDVDYTVTWDSEDNSVTGALEILKPDIFGNGGDRSDPSAWNSAEVEVCKRLGIEMVGGVGGTEKLSSSSDFVNRLRESRLVSNPVDIRNSKQLYDVKIKSYGCISSTQCPKCNVTITCGSTVKAGTREGNVRYVLGPCVCGLGICPECGHDWRPKNINFR